MMSAILLLLGAGLWSVGGSAAADQVASGDGRQGIAVPAYWSPTGAGAADFTQLVDAAPHVGLVVVNGPTSSAPKPFDPATAAQINRLYHEGVTVLGYVDTGYLGTTGMVTTRVATGSAGANAWQAQAAHDAADWFDLYGSYGLDGVFLDQVTSACGVDDENVDRYHEIADGLRQTVPDAFVAINPGTNTDECYAEVGDVIVLFENTYARYRDWTPPTWVDGYPARMFWHLVHDAPGVVEMRDAVELSRRRHAGYVYVTHRVVTATTAPWTALPTPDYWADQQRAVCLPRG